MKIIVRSFVIALALTGAIATTCQRLHRQQRPPRQDQRNAGSAARRTTPRAAASASGKESTKKW